MKFNLRDYLLKKIILIVFILLAANSLVFIIIRLVPGDPAVEIAGIKPKNEQILKIREELNLDKSIFEQYIIFIRNSIQFKFGKSYIYKEKVSKIIFDYLPNTLYLSITSIIFTVLISFPLGIYSSLKPDTGIDTFTIFISSSFLAIPNFLLGPVLILIFSVFFNLLPVSGSDSFKHIILPTLTLGLSMSAFLTKIIRASFSAEQNQAYVLFAKAKGLSEFEIIRKHVFKNAMIPVFTVLGLQFGALISGVIITETIFSWQGIGTILVNSIKFRDYPLIQGVVLLILFLYLLIHFIIDFLYLFIDPEMRLREV